MTKVSKEPLVSVIVPIYNVEEYLDKCVESIVNQTYKNLEIILVDDGSPDNSPKKCDEWAKKDKRIKVIHKENAGVSSARNMGIDKSSGEWITFVDADDIIEKTFVEEMYYEVKKAKADYICCGYKRVYDDREEKINCDGSIEIINRSDYLLSLLNVQNGYGFAHMKLINKNVIGKIRFDEKLKVGEDALFNIMLCDNLEKAIIYNKVLYNYRFNSNSVVRKYDTNYVDKYYLSMNVMKDYIEKKYNNEDIIVNLYNYIVYHLMLICVNYCYHPNNANKMNSLKEVCNIPLFKDAIKKSNYKDLSITRKITLFTLKSKMYFLTATICKIRQRQFKK